MSDHQPPPAPGSRYGATPAPPIPAPRSQTGTILIPDQAEVREHINLTALLIAIIATALVALAGIAAIVAIVLITSDERRVPAGEPVPPVTHIIERDVPVTVEVPVEVPVPVEVVRTVTREVPPAGWLPPCQHEDSLGCYWDAQTRGNGQGTDVVTLP